MVSVNLTFRLKGTAAPRSGAAAGREA
jgi:hypothetical protein